MGEQNALPPKKMGEHNLISESEKKNLVDKGFILKLETFLFINTVCVKQTLFF